MFVEELEGFSLLSQNDNLDLKGGKKGELAKKLEFLEVASQADKTLSQNYGSNSVPVVPASLMVKRAGSLDPITILYSWMERWTSSKYEFLGKLRKTLGSGIVHVVGWFSNLKDRIKCVFRNITASQASKTKVRSKKWKVIRTIGGILFNIGKKMIAKSTELMLDSIMVGLKKTMSKIFSDSFLSKEIAKISNWSDQFMGYKDKVFDYFDKIEKEYFGSLDWIKNIFDDLDWIDDIIKWGRRILCLPNLKCWINTLRRKQDNPLLCLIFIQNKIKDAILKIPFINQFTIGFAEFGLKILRDAIPSGMPEIKEIFQEKIDTQNTDLGDIPPVPCFDDPSEFGLNLFDTAPSLKGKGKGASDDDISDMMDQLTEEELKELLDNMEKEEKSGKEKKPTEFEKHLKKRFKERLEEGKEDQPKSEKIAPEREKPQEGTEKQQGEEKKPGGTSRDGKTPEGGEKHQEGTEKQQGEEKKPDGTTPEGKTPEGGEKHQEETEKQQGEEKQPGGTTPEGKTPEGGEKPQERDKKPQEDKPKPKPKPKSKPQQPRDTTSDKGTGSEEDTESCLEIERTKEAYSGKAISLWLNTGSGGRWPHFVVNGQKSRKKYERKYTPHCFQEVIQIVFFFGANFRSDGPCRIKLFEKNKRPSGYQNPNASIVVFDNGQEKEKESGTASIGHYGDAAFQKFTPPFGGKTVDGASYVYNVPLGRGDHKSTAGTFKRTLKIVLSLTDSATNSLIELEYTINVEYPKCLPKDFADDSPPMWT